jgi:hypothetical protein
VTATALRTARIERLAAENRAINARPEMAMDELEGPANRLGA